MNNSNALPLPPVVILSGIVILGIALRLMAFTGIFGADDVSIAHEAMKLLEEGFSAPEGHYAQRIGLIFPLALIFKLFGTGDWQFAVLPLAGSIGAMWLAYAIGRLLISEQAGLLAALLLAVFPLDITNATLLFPDAIMGTCVALAFYLVIRAETAAYPNLLAFIAGLLIGLGWLIKVEAPILLPVLAVYGLLDPAKRCRIVLLAGLGTFAVLATESLTYYLMAGDALRGPHAALNQGGGIFNEEYAAGQLWVFPKAWFVTAYDFGLHYYLLFAAMIWVIFGKRKECYVLLAWVVLVLLWLEFAGNPFAAKYSPKSHLARYCLTIAVPTVILAAAMLTHLWNTGRIRIAVTLAGLTIAAGLFLSVFNTLGSDGIKATKLGLDYALENRTFPLYLDKKSYDLAPWYLGNRIKPADIYPIQQHDFRLQTTRLLSPDEIKGWVLDNRVFADYAKKRYYIRPVAEVLREAGFPIVKQIDNPGLGLAYTQAKLMRAVLEPLPDNYLTSKVRGTIDDLLDGNEVSIYRAHQAPPH